MPTFVYYKPIKPASLFSYFAIGAISLVGYYCFSIMDAEETLPMKNKTMKYFNYHEEIAKHKDRPTFYRPPLIKE